MHRYRIETVVIEYSHAVRVKNLCSGDEFLMRSTEPFKLIVDDLMIEIGTLRQYAPFRAELKLIKPERGEKFLILKTDDREAKISVNTSLEMYPILFTIRPLQMEVNNF